MSARLADTTAPVDPAAPPMVSLYAIVCVHLGDAMLLSVDLCGYRVVALLNSGSSSNFVSADLMRHRLPAATPHPTLRVLVANGNRGRARAWQQTCP